MKKSLIALAALSAFATAAQAQSSVTVYGLMDVGYAASENEVTGPSGSIKNKQKNTANGDGGLATSRFGFRGTEDLGGGLKANFQLEWDLIDVGTGGNGNTNAPGVATNTNTKADGFGNRYSWVGLQDAKLGELRIGRQEQSIHSVVVAGSAGGANNTTGAVYSAATSVNGTTNIVSVRPHLVFVNRAVTYASPTINGFKVEIQTAKADDSTSNVSGKNDTKETGGSLKYSAGKLALAYGMADSKYKVAADANYTETKQQAISATYDLGVAKVFALHAKTKVEVGATTNGDTKNTELGVQVPVGKTTLWASAYDGDIKSTASFSASGTTVTNFRGDLKGYQVGARYDLSKRTAVYGIYGEQEGKGTGTAAGYKAEASMLAVGVRHTF